MLTIKERAINYTKGKAGQVKVTVAACKASGKTVFMVYSEDAMRALIEGESNALVFKEDGVRWAGRMVNKVDVHLEACRLTVNVAWNKFQVGSNGFMSDAQEQAVRDALNEGGLWQAVRDAALMNKLRGLTWEWTGHNHRRGVHDLHAVDAEGVEYWIEVKGVHGRLFYS